MVRLETALVEIAYGVHQGGGSERADLAAEAGNPGCNLGQPGRSHAEHDGAFCCGGDLLSVVPAAFVGEVGDFFRKLDADRMDLALEHTEAALDEGGGVELDAAIEGLVQDFGELHPLDCEGAKGLG